MKANKVAVISDLHASLNILNTFLKNIEDEGVEVILNLGDYISNGPNPREVFDIISKDKRFINIKGYDEDSLFHLIKCKEGIGQGEWIKNKLGQIRMSKLEAMPSLKKLTINKKSILMCHTNGWADILQIVAHSTKEEIRKSQYDFIMLGGSHKPQLTYAREIFYNSNIIDPGALRQKKEQGSFALIDFTQGEPNISFRNIVCNEPDIVFTETTKTIENQGEQEELKNNLLFIHGKKRSGQMYIDDEVVEKILRIGLKQSKYICIGCWSHENQIIRELLYYIKCRKIRTDEKGRQEWYIGEITKEVEELVLHNRLLPCGRLKWFEISFQERINSITPLYSIYHYGREGVLKRLSTKEIYTIKKLLDQYDIAYSTPEIEINKNNM